MNLMPALKAAGMTIGKYSPQILVGLGIAGFVTTVLFTAEAAPKSKEVIEEKEAELDRPLKATEKVQCAWKIWAPVISMGAISGAMIIGGHYMQTRRTIAMTAAYTMVAERADRYYNNMKEIAGRTKANDVLEKTDQDMVNDIPDTEFENAPSIWGGTDWFVDELSGQVFRHDIVKIREGVVEFNNKLMSEMQCDVNDLYDCIGLAHTEMGKLLLFDVDYGVLTVSDSQVVKRNGHACTVLHWSHMPRGRYESKYRYGV